MQHIFKQGSDQNAPVLLLLHGTGGTERDLLGIAEMVSPGSAVLSVRGNVSENGMPRFFRRLAEGVFDMEDLQFRTNELNAFVDQASADYGFDRSNVVAIGYSNGANIAASMLFHIPNSLNGAILHHPMVPRRGIELPSMSGLNVFIGAGRNDMLCSPQETEELAELLTGAGADVAIHWEQAGHQLTRTEVEASAVWFKDTFK